MIQANEGKPVYKKYKGHSGYAWEPDKFPEWNWDKFEYTTNPNKETLGKVVCKDCAFFYSANDSCKSNVPVVYLPDRIRKVPRNVFMKNMANDCIEFKESFLSKIRKFFKELLTFN